MRAVYLQGKLLMQHFDWRHSSQRKITEMVPLPLKFIFLLESHLVSDIYKFKKFSKQFQEMYF